MRCYRSSCSPKCVERLSGKSLCGSDRALFGSAKRPQCCPFSRPAGSWDPVTEPIRSFQTVSGRGILRSSGPFSKVQGHSPKFEQKVTKKCAQALRDAYGYVLCLSACYREPGPGIHTTEVVASKHGQRSQDLGGGNEDAGGSGASLTRRSFFYSEVPTRGHLNSSRTVCYCVSGTGVSACKDDSGPTTTSVLGGG